MIVERLIARRGPDPLAERPSETRPIPEFRQYTRMSPPRRRRNLVTQSSVPIASTLTPFTASGGTAYSSTGGAHLPESSVSLPATPSDSQEKEQNRH